MAIPMDGFFKIMINIHTQNILFNKLINIDKFD